VVDSRVFIRAHGRVVGGVLKYENTELYVSIGNNIRLEDAVAIVKQLLVEGKDHLYHYK
jgi:deoxyinosine 3'endonuclease (endonuclease V)